MLRRNARALSCIFCIAKKRSNIFFDSMHKILLALFGSVFLLSMVILVPYKMLQDEKTAATQRALVRIAEIAQAAKVKTGKELRQITGMACVSCECTPGANIQGIAYDTECFRNWADALSLLMLAASDEPFEVEDTVGRLLLPQELLRDSWGAPYLLGMDGGESPGGCPEETVQSAGPSGLVGSFSSLGVVIPTPCAPDRQVESPPTPR